MLRAVRVGSEAAEPAVGAAADVLAALRSARACFRPELAPLSGSPPGRGGRGASGPGGPGHRDGGRFSAVRSLLLARDRWRTRTHRRPTGGMASRPGFGLAAFPVGSGIGEGRWSLLPGPGSRVRRGGCRRGGLASLGAGGSGSLSPGHERPGRGGLAAAGPLGCGGLGRCGPGSRSESRGARWCGPRRLEARGLVLGGRFVG